MVWSYEWLVDRYFELRHENPEMKTHGEKFEGTTWSFNDNMAIRTSAKGWMMRVYRDEGIINVCVVAPDGNSKTYS